METELMATCWTSAGDTGPERDDPTSPVPALERVDACADAGYVGMGFVLADLRVQQRTGGGLADLRDRLVGRGMRHVQVELLGHWWEGPSQERDDLLGVARVMADAGLVAQVKATEDLSDDPVDPSSMMRGWWELAQDCHDVGASLALEPVPFSNLPSIEAGAAFVQEVGHPDGGLLVDYWHVVRGGSTARTLTEAIDPAFLVAVELCDGTGPVPPGMSLELEASTRRLLPGAGSWDVTEFVDTMRGIGYAGPWAVEVCSLVERRRPMAEAVASAAATARYVLTSRDRGGGSTPSHPGCGMC